MEETKRQLTDSVTALAGLAEAIADGDGPMKVEWYGDDDIRYSDPDIDDRIYESVLSVDTEIIKSVVFGTGGPHTEIEITFSEGMEPLRGRAVGYWGGDKVERHISSDDAETIAEYFGLTQ